MIQYINKDALVAEIERRLWLLVPKTTFHQQRVELEKLLSFINTLEMKEVDFEKELDKEWNKCEPADEGMGLEIASIEHEQFDNIAKHFFELGLKVNQKGE